MTNNKKQPGPKGFILVDLVDRRNVVEIPLTSNKAWLTLFYALPEELVSKAKAYYEQQDKIMRSEIQRLTRKERTHRLCTRGGLVEHFILEPDLLTDADVYILLSSLFESEETQEKLKALIEHRKEVNERNANKNP